nr:reverse transcriptase domain-containing protein [Tanacetum cinerariifolium]
MDRHNAIFVISSHTKKVFANMKREGNDFSGKVTPLFQSMIVQDLKDMGEGLELPTDPHYTPILTQLSSSPHQKEKKSRRKQRKEIKVPSPSSEIPNEEGVLDLEEAKTAQAKEIASLKNREDASKQGRMIDNIDQDVEITLVDDTQGRINEKYMLKVNDLDGDKVVVYVSTSKQVEQSVKVVKKEVSIANPVTIASEVVTTAEEERLARQKEEETNIALVAEWDNIQAMMDADCELASRLQEEERGELSIYEKSSEKTAKGSEKAQESSSKRAADKLEQEDAKRQRIEEENESAELKRCLEIILKDDDDVTIEATPLSSKSPTIVDYKIYKEWWKSFSKSLEQMPMYAFANMPAYANPNPTGLFPNPLGSVTPFFHWIEDYPLLDGLKIPSYIGSYNGKWTRSLVEHLSTYLPPTYKGLMEKIYTWVKAREAATNGVSNDQRDSFKRPKKSSWNNNKGQMGRSQSFLYIEESHKLLSNLAKSPREIFAIERVAKTFERFSREQSWPLEDIPLEVTIEEGPLMITKTLTFVIVRSDSPHNILLGRTAMQEMGIVVSTVHGAIKFHMPNGVGTIFSKHNSQRSMEEEGNSTNNATRSPKSAHRCFRMDYNPHNRSDENINYQRRNLQYRTSTEFVQSHRIDKTKKRSLAPGRNEAVRTQVEELVEAEVLQEVKYQSCVSNLIILKKDEGKWKLHIDFTDLNKACNKEPHLLPATELFPRCLQRIPLDSHGREGQRKNIILHKKKSFLLQKATLRFNKYRGHLSETHRQSLWEQNKKAYALSKLASMTFLKLAKEVLVEVIQNKSVAEKEIIHIVKEDEDSWMVPIREYLKKGILPKDPQKARKLRIKALLYRMIEERLY